MEEGIAAFGRALQTRQRTPRLRVCFGRGSSLPAAAAAAGLLPRRFARRLVVVVDCALALIEGLPTLLAITKPQTKCLQSLNAPRRPTLTLTPQSSTPHS